MFCFLFREATSRVLKRNDLFCENIPDMPCLTVQDLPTHDISNVFTIFIKNVIITLPMNKTLLFFSTCPAVLNFNSLCHGLINYSSNQVTPAYIFSSSNIFFDQVFCKEKNRDVKSGESAVLGLKLCTNTHGTVGYI